MANYEVSDWVEALINHEMDLIRPAIKLALDEAYHTGYADGWCAHHKTQMYYERPRES